MSFTTEVSRWRALSIRDPTANGHFLYTVKTTNVYCRPTCPARLARRANVGFCKTAAEAEAGGFRACKRCKPNEEIVEDPQAKAVEKACRLIDEAVERGDEKAGRLQNLAKNVGLTPRYFHKVFKDKTGLTPKEYVKAKNQGAGGAAADPFLHDGLNDYNPVDLETFDFNNLVDLDTDVSLSSEPTPPVASPEPFMPAVSGHETDMNLPPSTMSDFWPSGIGEGFSVDDAGLFQQMDVSSFNDAELFQQLEINSLSAKAMMTTTTAFDADAALLLGGGVFPEMNGALYRRDTFTWNPTVM